jgi:hypothetical protein
MDLSPTPQPTGNPLLDNPQLKAALTAQMGQQQAAAQPQGAIMPPGGAVPPPTIQPPMPSMPSMAGAPAPAMAPVKAPRGTSAGDQAELSRLENTGSGVSQIAHKIEGTQFGQNHPTLGKILGLGAQIPLQVLDSIAGAASPILRSVETGIPGTEEHHHMLVNQQQRQLGQDISNEHTQAQTSNLQQQPGLEQEKLENTQDVAQNKLNETQRVHDQQLREHGYKQDEKGNIVPLEYGEMSEPQQAVHDLKASQEELASATADLKKAQKDGIPVAQQQAQQRIRTAQANAATAAGRLGLSRESLGFHENEAQNKVDQPPAAVQSRAYQGGAIIEAGNTLKSEIDKHAGKLGNLGSYWTQYTNGTPIADPEVSGLMARIASYAALQPALHGFRGQQALAQFEKIIGGVPKNPEALKSAIDAIDDTAAIVQRTGSRRGVNPPTQGEPTRPANVPQGYVYKDGPKGKGWYNPNAAAAK